MKSELQKQNSKSNSVNINLEFEAITNAFCIEEANQEKEKEKEKVEFSVALLKQVVRAGDDNDDPQKMSDNTLVAISDIKPKDTIEAMLAAQMIATHHAVMDCYRIAAKSQTIDTKNLVFNSANKLTRTYTMQMEALNRYRGKGQQKMTVEHVHINSGGQAIIGNVTKNNTSIEGVKQKGGTLENEQ